MAIFMFRWFDNTITFIDAKNQAEAMLKADEFGDYDELREMKKIKNFAIDVKVELNPEYDAVKVAEDPIWEDVQPYGKLSGPVTVGEIIQEEVYDQIKKCKPEDDNNKKGYVPLLNNPEQMQAIRDIEEGKLSDPSKHH